MMGMTPSEERTLVRLPPPLRGRVGERGKPRALSEDMRRQSIDELGETINEDADAVLATRQAIEQVAPLSLALPRKGGGNPFVGASLTVVGTAVASVEPGSPA
jgi:hypothetical protein